MKTTTIPHYCSCTPEELAAATEEYKRLRMDPAWIMMAGFRRSALAAVFGSGGYFSPLQAVEFKDVIESKNYTPLCGNDGGAAQRRADQERAARAEWAEQQKKIKRAPTLREASLTKGPVAYAEWLKTAEGLAALKAGWD